MRKLFTASLLAATVLAPMTAQAKTYIVDKVIIKGNDKVPTEKLKAAMAEHPGAKIAVDDIIADNKALMAVYESADIGVKSNVSLVPKSNGHADVIFALTEVALAPPVVTMVNPKLHVMQFVGNKAVPTAALVAAANMKPGEDLTTEKVLAVQKAIKSVYDTKKLNIVIDNENRKNADGTYDVIWTLTESK